MLKFKLFAAAVTGMALLLSACSSDTPVDYSTVGPDGIVFQYDLDPGSPLPPDTPFLMPRLTVFGDGRVIRLAGDSQKPWPESTEQRLTPDGMQRLLRAARDAGLAGATNFGDTPDVVDGQVSTFILLDEVTRVPNLDSPGTAPLARANLRSFVARLQDLDNWMGAETSPPTPYAYAKEAVFAIDQGTATDAVPVWPLSNLAAGVEVGLGACTIFDTPALDQVKTADLKPGRMAFWRSGDHEFSVTFRPLLPGETDCASIAS